MALELTCVAMLLFVIYLLQKILRLLTTGGARVLRQSADTLRDSVEFFQKRRTPEIRTNEASSSPPSGETRMNHAKWDEARRAASAFATSPLSRCVVNRVCSFPCDRCRTYFCMETLIPEISPHSKGLHLCGACWVDEHGREKMPPGTT